MSTEISKQHTGTALSTIESEAQAIAAAAKSEGANELGPLLKFTKGHYNLGTEEVPAGRQYIAHIQHWTRGWVKFKGGCLIEHNIGRAADGFIVPEREDLDDADKAAWEKDASGNPKDPWSQQSYLPLEDIETGDIVTFVSGSVGGRQAVSRLCGRAAKHLVAMGQPRIKLAVESYKHTKFGRIDKPDFPIVGWTESALAEPATPSVEMDDQIPF
jgi:hypothetical protein